MLSSLTLRFRNWETKKIEGTKMDTQPIVSEQTYGAPAATAWQAITDAAQMRRWFFEPMQEFAPQVGFETEFVVHSDGVDYVHQWRVLEVMSQEKIVYGWKYEGIPGDSIVKWELSKTEDGTLLRVSHAVVEAFPQDDPVFSRESGQDGWDYFLGESLKEYLDGE